VSRLFFDFVSSYTTLIQFITGSAGTSVTGKVADNSSSDTIEKMMASYKSKTMTMGDFVRYAVKYYIK